MASLSKTTKGDARRADILTAAKRCFLRDGFHATSMQDLLQETGLSAGAFYRYFPSKQAIVLTLCADAQAELASLIGEDGNDAPPTPEAFLRCATKAIERMDKRDGLPRIVLLVWAETQRDTELKRTLEEALKPLFDAFEASVTHHRQDAASPAASRDIARALVGLMQGYIVQRALFGTSADAYSAGVTGLLGDREASKSPP